VPNARARSVQTVVCSVLLTLATACGGDSGDGGQEPPPPPPPPDPTIVTITGEFADHLAVAGGKLYWSERGQSPLMSAPASGGSPSPMAIKIGSPDGLLPQGTDLLWLDDQSGTSVNGCVGLDVVRLLRRTRAGTTVTLAEGEHCSSGTGDLVLGGGGVYWVTLPSSSGQAIRRTVLSGGASETVYTSELHIVALTGDAQYLYWLEDNYPDPVAALRRIPFAGGPVETLVEGLVTQAQTFAINGSLAFYDAIDDQGERLFAVPLAGGPPTPLTTVTIQPVKLAADETTLYWIDPSSLHDVPVGGGTAATVAPVSGQPFDLLVRETDVVWSESSNSTTPDESGSVRHVAKSGGAASTLAEGEDAPRRLAGDATWLYWAEGSYGSLGPSEGIGRIARVPADGGIGTTVAAGVSSDDPVPFTVNDDWIVFGDKGRVKRLPRAGGTVETVSVGGDDFVVGVAADGSYAYWVEGAGMAWRAPLAGGAPVMIGDPTNHAGPGGPIAVVGGTVVWAPHFDVLLSVPATGGTPGVLGSGLQYISDMVADQDAAYVSEQDGGRILRVPLAGGSSNALAPAQPASWRRLAQDESTVYWVDQVDLRKVPKAGGDFTQLYSVAGSMDPLLPASVAVDGESVYWTVPASQVIVKLPK